MAELGKRSNPNANTSESRPRKRSRWDDAGPQGPPASAEQSKSEGESVATGKPAANVSLSAIEQAKQALQKQKALKDRLKSTGLLEQQHQEQQHHREEKRKRSKGEELLAKGKEGHDELAVMDRRLAAPTKPKAKKPQKGALQFYQSGEVQAAVDEDRRKRRLYGLEEPERPEQAAEEAEEGPAGRIAEPPPEVEWWDKPLLQNGTYGDVQSGTSNLKESRMTIYVEHPVPLQPAGEKPPPEPQPLKLTKKEQRKLRKQRREARQRERQDLIRQGLMEPPKPKVKISNLARVMGADGAMDPTSIEQEVRQQEEERRRAHEDRNLARQLTPAERREKTQRKMFDPDPVDTYVSVYRLDSVKDGKQRFKIEVNAKQNRLTGVCLSCDRFVAVIVEGCNKSQKRFSKLMLRRIDWGEDNRCIKAWEGSISGPIFSRFTYEERSTASAARKFLQEKGVAHYFDICERAVQAVPSQPLKDAESVRPRKRSGKTVDYTTPVVGGACTKEFMMPFARVLPISYS